MTSESEKISIDSLIPNTSEEGVRKSLKESNLRVIERKENQKRLNLYHIMVHIIALIVILPYVALLTFSVIYDLKVPQEYSTIVSVVIGFYFGRSLFNK